MTSGNSGSLFACRKDHLFISWLGRLWKIHACDGFYLRCKIMYTYRLLYSSCCHQKYNFFQFLLKMAVWFILFVSGALLQYGLVFAMIDRREYGIIRHRVPRVIHLNIVLCRFHLGEAETKLPPFLQTTFSNEFSWMKIMNCANNFPEVCSPCSN